MRTVSIDTEGTGANVYRGARPFAVSACFDDGRTLYWEWPVDPFTRMPDIPKNELDEVRELCGDPSIDKGFWNLPHDVFQLRSIGVETVPKWTEVMFLAKIVESDELNYRLKHLAKKYAGIAATDEKELKAAVERCRRAAKKLGWKIAEKEKSSDNPVAMDYWLPSAMHLHRPDVAEELAIPEGVCEKYAVEDAVRTEVLRKIYLNAVKWIETTDDRIKMFDAFDLEMRLLPHVLKMREVGVCVDMERVEKLREETRKRRAIAFETLAEASGNPEFNPNSPKQLIQLLFEPHECRILVKDEGTGEERTIRGTDVRLWHLKRDPKKGDSIRYRGSKGIVRRGIVVERFGKLAFSVDPERCLNLPYEKTSQKTGDPSTSQDALEDHFGNPVVDAVLEIRTCDNAEANSFRAYELLSEEDSEGNTWIHPYWDQYGASKTSRFACREPNMQNVSNPKKSSSKAAKFLIGVRECFVPRSGVPYAFVPESERSKIVLPKNYSGKYVWLLPDYSQIELAIFAAVSNETALIDALKRGGDLHTTMANRSWGRKGTDRPVRSVVDALSMKSEFAKERKRNLEAKAVDLLEAANWDLVAVEESLGVTTTRSRAKNLTYCTIYGGGLARKAEMVGCPIEEMKILSDEYDRAHPRMMESFKEIVRQARRKGYVVSLYGRRFSVDRERAYKGVNYKVQGSAAELLKRAMISCGDYLDSTGLDARIALSIHDEIVFEFLREHLFKKVVGALSDRMTDHGGVLPFNIKVDMEIAPERWSEIRKLSA